MKKISISLLMAVIFFLGIANITFAENIKIGIVDFNQILMKSSSGKIAKTEINKKGKKMEETLNVRAGEIEELRKKIEQKSLVMSKEKREEIKREIRIKINDFQTMKESYMKEFKLMEKRLLSKIRKDVAEIAKKIGKKKGLNLILERNEAGVFYFSESIDITPNLIKEYNSTAKK